MRTYTMKEACGLVHMSYETLKFYCKNGLVPNVKRDERNRRIFDERNIAWINSLNCLRDCGMGVTEMKEYLDLCLQGEPSIPQRQEMMKRQRAILEERKAEIERSIAFIDAKQRFYDDVLAGRTQYYSNLIDTSNPTSEPPDELRTFLE